MEKEYNEEEAIAFIVNTLDPEITARLGEEGIQDILELEMKYVENKTPGEMDVSIYPVDVDWEDLMLYIQNETDFTREDVDGVLDAETEYLDSIGLIDHEGWEKWNN
jgi:ERCC4-related helicase